MTQRIELFFLKKNAKNWTLFWTWLERIESLSEYDSKNRTLFFLNTTQWIEPAFFNMTQRIEPFSIGLQDLMLLSLTQRIELFLTRTDRTGPFFLNMTQRIEFFLGFFTCLLFSKMMHKIEPFFFEYDAKNWTLFSLNVTSRIWTFLEYDAKNWTLFFFDAKKRTFISLIWMTPRIVFFKQKILNELNFLKYDSKNWTFEPCVKKKRLR